jgi:hypothetical protein
MTPLLPDPPYDALNDETRVIYKTIARNDWLRVVCYWYETPNIVGRYYFEAKAVDITGIQHGKKYNGDSSCVEFARAAAHGYARMLATQYDCEWSEKE